MDKPKTMSRMVAQVVPVFAVLLFLGDYIHAQSLEPKLSVAGLSVARPIEGDKFNRSMVMGLQSGTRVHVLVELEGFKIVKVRSKDKVEVNIVDSNSKEMSVSRNFSNIGFFATVSDDGSYAVIPFSSEDVPSKGATSVTLESEVMLICGDETGDETADVSLEVDKKVKLGAITATISNVKKGFQEGSYQVEFRTNESFDSIAGLELITKKGETVKVEGAGSGSFGFGDKKTYTRSYRFAAQSADIAKIKVKFYKSLKEFVVPIEVTANLGLK